MTKLMTKILAFFMGAAATAGVGLGLNGNEARPASAAITKITTVENITSGSTYHIGATTGGNNFYLSVDSSSATDSIAGTAVADETEANTFVFTKSNDSWTIKDNSTGNYLGLKNSKDNGKLQVLDGACNFSITNNTDKGLLRITIGSYSIQKNNSGTQFGSYGNSQTDVWLEQVGGGTTPDDEDDGDYPDVYGIGTATYTVASVSSVNTTGDLPNSTSVASYSSTYTSAACQLTKTNSMTLDLTKYAGVKITSLVLSMRSNSSGGSGYLSFVSGSTTLATIGSSSAGIAFNKSEWAGKWSTSYIDVNVSLSNTDYIVKTDEHLNITIGATANSLYVQSFSISWEGAAKSTDPEILISNSTPTNKVVGQTISLSATTSNFVTEPTEFVWSVNPTDALSTPTTGANQSLQILKSGTIKITASVGDVVSNEIEIQAIEKAITSITLSSGISVLAGSKFAYSGEITANYNDGDTATLDNSDVTFNLFNGSSGGTASMELVIGETEMTTAMNGKYIGVSYNGIDSNRKQIAVNIAASIDSISENGFPDGYLLTSGSGYYLTFTHTINIDGATPTFNAVSSNPNVLTAAYNATENRVDLTPVSEGKAKVTISVTVSGYNASLESNEITVLNKAPTVNYYEKVTETRSDYSGQYLIVCESQSVAFKGSLTTLDASSNYATVAISNNKIVSNDTTNAISFTIESISGGYSIQSASGYYIGSTKYDNRLDSSETTAYTNTITINEGNALIVSSETTLKYNGNSGQTRFRYYKTGQTAVQLYRLKVDQTPIVEEFINTYMHMTDYTENQGLCKGTDGYYATAKAALLALGVDAIEAFQENDEFNDAQARYEAWALACGDNSPYAAAQSSGRVMFGNIINKDGSKLAILLAVFTSVTFASYFLLSKKRKTSK